MNERTKGSGINNKENLLVNPHLAEELHIRIIKKFKRRKVYSNFKDSIWGVDLADMQLISKYGKIIRYLLCVIDLFSRYAWVIPLKNKEGESIVEGFQKILDDSNRKPNKIWVDHGSEFYNNKFKGFLKENDIKMYSTFNEGKSVVAERFIKTLKNKIYKHMTTIAKSVYIDDLDDIVKKYNNTVYSSIKMKPKDVADDSFIEYPEENWTYLINDLNCEEIKGSFYEKELQKTNQKEFRIEKVIKKKGDKLYAKWKGYNNSFNSWIDKKDIV